MGAQIEILGLLGRTLNGEKSMDTTTAGICRQSSRVNFAVGSYTPVSSLLIVLAAASFSAYPDE